MGDGDRNNVHELPVQMSPFCHSRWDEDAELLKRRKQQEIQNLKKPNEKNQKFDGRTPEILEKLPVEVQEIIKEKPVEEISKKVEFTTEESAPKPVQRQCCEKVEKLSIYSPAPPNLFPVIKFPERRGNSSDMRAYKEPSPTNPVTNVEEQSKLPPNIVFHDFLPEKQKVNQSADEWRDKSRIYHYGVPLPLWPA